MCPGDPPKRRASTTASLNNFMASADFLEPPRPSSPPVVGCLSPIIDESSQSCLACHKLNTIRVDWQQGDRVCINCGVVDQGHLLDTRPDWRDYDNEDGTHTGAPARSGLVPVDETRYVGGLQPTMLSSYVYGSTSAGQAGRIQATRTQLASTNRKMDRLMENTYFQQLKDTRISRAVARKRQREEIEFESSNSHDAAHLRPELDAIVALEEEEKEEAFARQQDAEEDAPLIPQTEKWSMERAIRLHGSAAEQSTLATNSERLEDRQYNSAEVSNMKKAAKDLYDAQFLLTSAARELNLPEFIINTALNILCRYAALRDGIKVRGVASALQQKRSSNNATSLSSSSSRPQEKEAIESLRNYNRLKQMGALSAAILFYTARNAGHARTLKQICNIIPNTAAANNNNNGSSSCLDVENTAFIKSKHCSKAMAEMKQVLPDVCRPPAPTTITGVSSSGMNSSQHAVADNDTATVNFVDYSIRKLSLPPVAQACVRTLVLFLQRKEGGGGGNNGKLATLCASSVGLVSIVGLTMKRLAEASSPTNNNLESKCLDAVRSKKRLKQANKTDSGKNDDTGEDLLGCSHDVQKSLEAEQRAYEMRRVWDAWIEQPSWFRGVGKIEHSCGVSRRLLLVHYKRIFQERRELLAELQGLADDTTQPLASVLLPHVTAAVPLMEERDLV